MEPVEAQQLEELGVPEPPASALAAAIRELAARYPGTDPRSQDELWRVLRTDVLAGPPALRFAAHRLAYERVFAGRATDAAPPAAWAPTPEEARATNLGRWMAEKGIADYRAFHRWSAERRDEFWAEFLGRIAFPFKQAPVAVREAGGTVRRPRWLPEAVFNVADVCFRAAEDRPSIVSGTEGDARVTRTANGELGRLVRRVEAGLDGLGLGPRDRVALYLPMTPEAVAAYLGVLRSGRCAVGIADASAPPDLAKKIRIADAKAVLTVDGYVRGGKAIPIYPKAVEAKAPATVVLPGGANLAPRLREGDVVWEDFLGTDAPRASADRGPEDLTNVLFSSGTTKDPKAIPWTQVTPIKCLMDAYCHHDVRPDDVLAWPTSFGWMMGPWLTFAALGFGATMAIYNGDPRGRGFGEFVQKAGVTMLGVVPKLVADWRARGTMEGLDWSAVRRFSNTGEASDPEDTLWLMHRAGYKPVIEYCGGTEIGGGYITGTMVQAASPATFSTPSLGLDFHVLDEKGAPSRRGEVGLVPPSIGLSNDLLNNDHDEEYYGGLFAGPDGETLRRHGDLLERLGGGYWRHLGRRKDMINVYGVKTSSEEIRAVLKHPDVVDTKPVAIDVQGRGQHRLVVYVVPRDAAALASREARARLVADFNRLIKERLNPLLAHVEDVVATDALPQAGPGKTLTSEWFRADYLSRLAAARG